ncbi:hypothetical protein [Hyalangium rubrum]|uniref:Uncharacterized protein n=1 Tax=Hyalangium rubrum TaxID=3103134 RepID=A0ABU5H0Y4_9BACT|nr:hypothetical protein [Hyalangium sp. s54d21]MDY7226976.1 hypothetical protein [Hyalangium sp. s54d21]
MKDDEKLDLSALDDLRDPARFDRLVGNITRQALAARRRPSLWEQLTTWAWPALATAALVPLLVWGARLARPPLPAEPTVASASVRSQVILAWALQRRAPSTEELLLYLPAGGARHEP